MKKQTNLHSIKLLSLAIVAAITIIIGATISISAQDKPTFKVGDRVEAKPYGTEWSKATVVKIVLTDDGRVNGYTIKMDDDGGDYVTNVRNVRPLKEVEKNNTAKDNKNQTTDADKENDAKQQSSGYKVGERVKASPLFRKEDDWFEPCTVTAKLNETSYAVRCDPAGEASFIDYTVRTDFMRRWANATPAPTFKCSFEQPAGTITRTSPAMAATFKRLIYQRNMNTNKLRVGMQFEVLEIGKPFKNTMTTGGLLFDSAPRNAMIYPVRAKYKICKEGSSGEKYNYMAVIEQKHACFKDAFGDWTCPTNSPSKQFEAQKVPKDQK